MGMDRKYSVDHQDGNLGIDNSEGEGEGDSREDEDVVGHQEVSL
jgi:hypothetical protein